MEQLSQHDPRRIGPFEVLGRLGAGGMGLVYLARSASGRRVAIKTVRAELAEDQLFRVRFTREVEAARAVGGFYTAAVVDADPRAAVPWLATAYVPAPSLEEIIERCGPLPVQAVRWLAAGIAEALQSIHSAGLVHRDMKPSNVLVVEDGPRVIDFGIASGVSNTRLTMTNVAVGTPAYMSPEQARDSRSVTGASDVFSLGSTLVYAATGHAPYHGANPVETVFMLLREGPDLSGLPDELRPLIDSCLKTQPENRPSPVDLQAQLAPHLFAADHDGSEASAWLPEPVVALIESRRGRRVAAQPRADAVGPPPPPDSPPEPMPPDRLPAEPGPPAQRSPGHRDRGGELTREHAPVRLPGSDVAGSPTASATGPRRRATDWVRRGAPHRPHAVGQRAGRQATRPAGAVPANLPGPGEHRGPAAPARWRPWRFRMSNDVWGTPIVSEGLLYVTSFEVHALDVATGRREFRTRDVAWTMAVAQGQLLASDGASLYALGASDGSDRWRAAPDGWVYSLQVEAGSVCTGIRGGEVQVRDAATGELRWKKTGGQTTFESPESGPLVVGDTVYYFGGGLLHAVEARSGRQKWSYPVGEDCPAQPIEADGSVYLTAGTRVLALSAADGRERWRFDAPAGLFTRPTHVPGSGVTGGGVYVVDYLGTVYALDPASGRDRWRVATESRQGAEPVVVVNGTVHLGSGKALYTMDAVSGAPRWRFAAQDDLVGSPVIAGGRVHFGSKDHCLYTVDADGGQLRWKLETGGEITGSPVVANGVVYACSKDRCVYALDAGKGAPTRAASRA
ncbi:serine/threonine protein kinase [Wenjunlia vitaminophila]|uniref:Serine/threonine-protein kinase AfsK n=1 Tax=Wenjunlia vitaminophila TaxID=76728 RepID=A0A0T6LW60_WENVI|nr:serine/threonine-protein kinase [Wenjunlia vitaminophila]KRV50082.1 serine/threonine protein kinase [Wenjunlia vitaminophila]